MFIMITMNVMMRMIIILVTLYGHLTEANIPPMFNTMGQLHCLLHLFVKDIITIVVVVVFVVFVVIISIIIVVFVVIISIIIVKRILMLQ